MSLKSAAFLALIGSLLLTLLLGFDFFRVMLNTANGLVPAVNLLSTFIQAFASLTITIFFFVFYSAQR